MLLRCLTLVILIWAVLDGRQPAPAPERELSAGDRELLAVVLQSQKPDSSHLLLDTTVTICNAADRGLCIDRSVLERGEPPLLKSPDSAALVTAFVGRNERPWRLGQLDVGLRSGPGAQIRAMFASGRRWLDVQESSRGYVI